MLFICISFIKKPNDKFECGLLNIKFYLLHTVFIKNQNDIFNSLFKWIKK